MRYLLCILVAACGGGSNGDANVALPDAYVGPDAGIIGVTPGQWCPVEEKLGRVEVLHEWGSVQLVGEIYDRVPEFNGPPRAESSPCAHFRRMGCVVPCEGSDACSYEGECSEAARTRKDVQAQITTTAGTTDFVVNPITGAFAEALPAWGSVPEYALWVHIPGLAVLSFTAAPPTPFPDHVAFDDSGAGTDSGPVTIAWDSADEDAKVLLHLRANHHADVGFSQCPVDDALEQVVASAEIVDPLRPTTGFEGGTAAREFVGAAQVNGGCIELAVSTRVLLMPN